MAQRSSLIPLALASLVTGCVGRTGFSTWTPSSDPDSLPGDTDRVLGDARVGDAVSSGDPVGGDASFPELTHTVTSTADTHDTTPGDEVCADAALECTLRAAVEEANARPGRDTIELPTGVIFLSEGEIPVTDVVEIVGRHARLTEITCHGNSRAFTVTNTNLSLIGLTLQQCHANGDGGAIWGRSSHLSIDACELLWNSATGSGGAVLLSGTPGRLASVATGFANNTAGGAGGAIDVQVPDVDITASIFRSNSAASAGAVLAFGGDSLRVASSTFSFNRATGSVAGALDAASHGPLTIENNTFANNDAATEAGGVRVTVGAARLVHNTFDINIANTEGGSVALAGTASAELANNILQRGFAGGGGDPHCDNSGTGTLASLGGNVSDSAAADCSLGASDFAEIPEEHLSPALALRGGPTPTLSPVFGSPAIDAAANQHCLPTDQRGLPRIPACDAGSVEVQDGGPIPCCLTYQRSWLVLGQGVAMTPLSPRAEGDNLTYTVSPPLPAGIVLNANGTLSGTPPNEWSQRTYTITASNSLGGTTTDLEILVWPAFEVTSTVDEGDDNPTDGICHAATADACTLRAALEETNMMPRVVVLAPATYDIATTLQAGPFVALTGQDAQQTAIDGQGNVRVLTATGGEGVWIADLTIQNGRHVSGAGGGGIHATGGLRVSNAVFDANVSLEGGGALWVQGRLELEFSQVTNNQCTQVDCEGGAIRAFSGGNVTDSTLEGNFADGYGGAIFNDSGTLLVARSLLQGNDAIEGGAIWSGDKLWAESSTFFENTAIGEGGAIGIYTVNFRSPIAACTFAQNDAASGGAIAILAGEVELNGNILATSSGGNCSTAVASGSYNVEDANTCGLGASNQVGALPGLEATPSNHGGVTHVIGLQGGSVAIDLIPVGRCSAQDQTGHERPFDGDGNGTARCDAGAFELP